MTAGKDDDGAAINTISDEQFAEITALQEKSGVTSQMLCDRFDIESVKDLPASKFNECLTTFRNHMRNSKNQDQS